MFTGWGARLCGTVNAVELGGWSEGVAERAAELEAGGAFCVSVLVSAGASLLLADEPLRNGSNSHEDASLERSEGRL